MKGTRLADLALMAAFVAVFAMPAQALDQRSGRHDPAKGKLLFEKHCAGCHGVRGKGDGYKMLGRDPANLASPETGRKSDAELLATIHEGKTNMPAWEYRFDDEESRDVLAYVRTLGK